MLLYDIEYTDTFSGEPNYSWVRRAVVTMPELTHYGYDGGTNYCRVNKVFKRELVKKAKAAMNLANVRGKVTEYGEMIEFRPFRSCTIMFITYRDE